MRVATGFVRRVWDQETQITIHKCIWKDEFTPKTIGFGDTSAEENNTEISSM